ncbi:alpha/beta fold hydrolase [Furfurilactobacillus sp. WILCCON 0119]
MTSTTFTCPSTDHHHQLVGRQWLPTPPTPIVGTLQIVHGMAEHINRYAHFATFMSAHGWVVAGADHLGHGQTVGHSPLGYFGAHDPVTHLIDDELVVAKRLRHDYPDQPHILLGHSMGAMIVQLFLTRYDSWVDGAVIIGSAARNPALILGRPVTALLNKLAPKRPNHFLDNMAFGGYARRFPESWPFQWLSANPENVHAYNHDPLAGFTFTNNGFNVLFELADRSTRRHWYQGIDSHMPMLFMSGQDDPVGGFGHGPKRHTARLRHAGFNDVALHLWPQMRHEILNEGDRERVYAVLLEWLSNHQTPLERK